MTGTAFPESVERWVALRTAARWEKKLADLLAAAAVPVYLPTVTRFTGVGGRKRVAVVPLFGGYVFCGEDEFAGNRRITAGTRAKVAQILRPPDYARLRGELAAIAGLLTDRELVQERTAGGVGDVVRVTGGPLAGSVGPIVRVKPNRWVVVLEVGFLGARLEAEVDERLVEKVL